MLETLFQALSCVSLLVNLLVIISPRDEENDTHKRSYISKVIEHFRFITLI